MKRLTDKLISMTILMAVGSGFVQSATEIKHHIKLALPVETPVSEQLMQPVPYAIRQSGEFLDVDLPDEFKNNKPILIANSGTDKNAKKTTLPSGYAKYSIQVGVFKNRDNARRLEQKLLNQYIRAYVVEKTNLQHQLRYHVRFGEYKTRRQAEQALLSFKKQSDIQALIVSN